MKCVTPVDSVSRSFVSCERKGASLLDVTFYGVRGSTPTACERTRRYGGNTACVALQVADEPPLLLDLGTGLRFFGETQPDDGSFQGSALVSHLHWDHVQGLPFFVPILRPGASFDVYAPTQEDGRSVAEAFDSFMRAPYFPVVGGRPAGRDPLPRPRRGAGEDRRPPSSPRWPSPTSGRTFGYRIEWGGASVAYLPDHQQPSDGGFDVCDAALELADGVDLLIHDAQYTQRRVRQEVDVGPLHLRVRHVGGQAGRGRVGGAVPPRPDPVRRRARRGAAVLRAVRRPHRRVGRGGRRRASASASARPNLRPMADFDSARFRHVLGHFPTGVTVVTSALDGAPVRHHDRVVLVGVARAAAGRLLPRPRTPRAGRRWSARGRSA